MELKHIVLTIPLFNNFQCTCIHVYISAHYNGNLHLLFNIFWAWQTRSVSVLILGVGLLAECILAIGPFDDSVAAVEHPCQLPPAPLDTIHRVVFAPHLPVVERARGRSVGSLSKGGRILGVPHWPSWRFPPRPLAPAPPFPPPRPPPRLFPF